MIFGFGETLVVHTRTRSGQDAYGNDVFTTTDTTLTNVPVWPAGATELVQGEDLTITGLYALLPAGSNVTAIDYVTRQRDGKRYEVDGEPGFYTSPFTGLDPGVRVHLTKVEG